MPILIPDDESSSASRYTTSELVEEALQELAGHSNQMGRITWLTQEMSASDLSFQVNDAGTVSRGIVEVGDELVFVATSEDGNCTVAPFGRGYRSTTARSWPPNTEVTYGPKYPRHAVLSTVNDVIQSVYPLLWGSGVTEFLWTPVVQAFELPAEAEGVLAVDWDPVGPQDSWYPVHKYRFEADADLTDFPTGKSIWLPELTPGRTVRVRYRKRPTTLALTSNFVDCGLSESAWQCIKYGALHRLAASVTLGQLGTDSAVAAEFGRTRSTSALEVGERFYAMHVQFLEEERRRLLDAEPIRVNYTR